MSSLVYNVQNMQNMDLVIYGLTSLQTMNRMYKDVVL